MLSSRHHFHQLNRNNANGVCSMLLGPRQLVLEEGRARQKQGDPPSITLATSSGESPSRAGRGWGSN